MAKQLSILFVASESLPFAKMGGVGDFSVSYTLAMRDLGEDIRLMMPKYGAMSERRNRIHEINRLRDIPIKIGDTLEKTTVKSSSIQNPRVKVQCYITTNYRYFDSKKGIICDPKTGLEFADNDDRFIFFARSVIETCLLLGWFPDIIHCNDWYTALVPVYARVMFPQKFKKTKFMITIHNFDRQGEFPKETFAKTGLPAGIEHNFIHNDKCNFLKAGILYSDYINTVSSNYAERVLEDDGHSCGMTEILEQVKDKFKGITNGIDTFTWDIKTDPLIKVRCNEEEGDFQHFKTENKKELHNVFEMPALENAPLIGMVMPLIERKGINLFMDAADKLFKENIQIVLLGEGVDKAKNKLKQIQKKYNNKFAFRFGYDEALAHQIEAGSDMFLLPSKYEPCGLNSMYSMAYGTVPIVSRTGGLIDIIDEFDPETKLGNGIFIDEHKVDSLLESVQKALTMYQNKSMWETFIKNCISTDVTWNNSIVKYDEIYKNLTKD